MIKTKNLLAVLMMSLSATAAAYAQSSVTASDDENAPRPYTFVGIQGGGQVTFTNSSFTKLATPIGGVTVGRFFVPAVGARLSVQGLNNKGGYKVNGTDHTYKFKYVTSDIDLLFNLSNIFLPHKVHPLNLYLIGGVGLSYSWDKEGMQDVLAAINRTEPLSWEDDRLVHNFRVGLQLEANVARHWGINLEVAANNLHDRFNAKLNGNNDWQATAMLGVTYKFGMGKASVKKAAPAPVVTPPVKQEPAPEPVVIPVAPKVKESIRIEVFFDINSAKIQKAGEERKVSGLAQWLRRHPNTKVTLTGYADAGTGNAEINEALSEKRVLSVANLLKDRHGIAADRIVTDFKGDTVQPFGENEMNRVTIGIAQE